MFTIIIVDNYYDTDKNIIEVSNQNFFFEQFENKDNIKRVVVVVVVVVVVLLMETIITTIMKESLLLKSPIFIFPSFMVWVLLLSETKK